MRRVAIGIKCVRKRVCYAFTVYVIYITHLCTSLMFDGVLERRPKDADQEPTTWTRPLPPHTYEIWVECGASACVTRIRRRNPIRMTDDAIAGRLRQNIFHFNTMGQFIRCSAFEFRITIVFIVHQLHSCRIVRLMWFGKLPLVRFRIILSHAHTAHSNVNGTLALFQINSVTAIIFYAKTISNMFLFRKTIYWLWVGPTVSSWSYLIKNCASVAYFCVPFCGKRIEASAVLFFWPKNVFVCESSKLNDFTN